MFEKSKENFPKKPKPNICNVTARNHNLSIAGSTESGKQAFSLDIFGGHLFCTLFIIPSKLTLCYYSFSVLPNVT